MKRHVERVTGLLILMLFGGAASADVDLSISPTMDTFTSGSIFNVEVNVSNANDLYGYQFDVTFNPEVLAAVGASDGSFLARGGSTYFISGTPDNNSGVLSATANTLVSPVAGVDGSGDLAVLTFKAIASGLSSIALSNIALIDSAFNSLSVQSTSATVTVSSPQMSAPEMDPSWAVSGLTMLLGALAVLRGGPRKVRAQ